MPNPLTLAKAKEKLLTLMRARVRAGDDSPWKYSELVLRVGRGYTSRCLLALAQEGVLVKGRRGEWALAKERHNENR